MSELINELLRVIDTRMVECREAHRELQDLEFEKDEDEGDEPREEPESPSATLRDAVELMAVVRRMIVGRSVREIHAAFGAPGDWGYETKIGAALSKLYRGAPAGAPEPDQENLSTDRLAEIAKGRGFRLLPLKEADAELLKISLRITDTVEQLRVESVVAEREACARELDALADEVQREIDATSPIERAHRGELLAQRAILAKAVAAIRARSNGGAR